MIHWMDLPAHGCSCNKMAEGEFRTYRTKAENMMSNPDSDSLSGHPDTGLDLLCRAIWGLCVCVCVCGGGDVDMGS